jgi:hypothetical protein
MSNMVNVLIDLIDKEYCGFAVTSPSIGCDSTPNITSISSTLIDTLQWPLLMKQCDFWKPKNQTPNAWALYAPIASP